jgi:hypothetical protein
MSSSDIKIQVTPDNKLVIHGFRGPTTEELQTMNRILDSKFNFTNPKDKLVVSIFFGVVGVLLFLVLLCFPRTCLFANFFSQARSLTYQFFFRHYLKWELDVTVLLKLSIISPLVLILPL